MKLKVIHTDDTPEKAMRRVVIRHDDDQRGWIRDDQDLVFMLWSNCDKFRGDKIYDRGSKKRVEVESPFVEKLDEDGYGTGEYELRKDIIAFGVDVYDHSGLAFALHGEGSVCFSCPWDTARNVMYLWTDKERWDRLCGNCEWKFADGKPTDELMKAARDIARGEIEEMNLCERGSYYGYETEDREIHHEKTEVTYPDGRPSETFDRDVDEWVDGDDSCWGFLTDKPAQDCDFPLGVPVTTTEDYLVGETFEQECFTYVDKATGKYLYWEWKPAAGKPEARLVDDPRDARLMCREFLANNLAGYEKDFGLGLDIADVTEKVWANYPECLA